MRLFSFIFLFIIHFQFLFAQSNLTLLGRKTYTEDLSDVWGYAANSKEYALVGVRSGVSIVDVTNPTVPTQSFFVTTAASDWHDIATWNGYAYITNETGGGLTIVDLNFLPDSIKTYNWDGGVGLSTAHTVCTDENGIAYVAGGNSGAGRGVLMFDVDSNPISPPLVGRYNLHYVHDVFVRGDTMWTAEVNDGIYSAVNISDKNNPVVLATNNTPNNFTHNVWLSDDGTTLLTTDEVSNAYITSYDVSDIGNISQLDLFQFNAGSNSLPHNVHYVHDFAVTSYYRDGVVMIDASDPKNLIAVGNYDTSPLSGGGFNGCWSVYPYLPSGNLLASDIEQGLFVLAPVYEKACYLEGIVTDIVTGQRINNVSVKLLPSNPVDFTNLLGEYKTGIADSGTYSVEFSKTGYSSHVENNVLLDNGVTAILNVQLIPQLSISLSGSVIDAGDNQGIAGSSVLFTNSVNNYLATTDSLGNFTIDSFETGEYQAFAGNWGYMTVQNNLIIFSDTSSTFNLASEYYDDFLFDFGWTQTSTASSGAWERGSPIGTSFNSQVSNPGSDVPGDFGDECFVTGNGGGQASADDVDNGIVTLTSPPFDLSGYFDPYISYRRWFFNAGGAGGPNDTLKVSLTNGTDTVITDIVTNATGSNAWNEIQIRVNDFLPASPEMSLIFETGDNSASAHLVEAGVDLFFVFDSIYPPVADFISDKNESCPGDTFRMTDQTLYQPNAWLWEFPGGIPPTSTEQNPIVTYPNPGTYDVKLSSSNVGGIMFLVKQSFVVIHEPPTFQAIIAVTSTPFTSDGSITLSISGNPPFTIEWSDGSTDSILQNLSAGEYSVTIADSFGCVRSDTFIVLSTPIQLPVVDFTSNKIEGCPGDTFWFSDLTANNPDSLLWEFPGSNLSSSVDSNPIVIYENSGIYSVTLFATNAAGTASQTKQSYIKINFPPITTMTVTNASTYSSNDGEIAIIPSGNSPFQIEWGNGSADSVLQNLSTGDYSVTVTDMHGCQSSVTVTVGFGTSINDMELTVKYFPNPFKDYIEIETAHPIELSIVNTMGVELERMNLLPKQRINWGENQQAGIYFMVISSKGKKSSILKLIKIK